MKYVEVYNLPAGTGKTYGIVKDIDQKVFSGENKILYITYTNRAKEEAQKQITETSSSLLKIETVHTFVHQFLKDYLKEEKVVEIIRENFEFEPNERSFYRYNHKRDSRKGEIGHDDLIKVFTYLISHKNLPWLQEHLLRLFDYVYIDEFQDLDLNFIWQMINLYRANGFGSKLYIFGDTSQQIYDPVNHYQEEKKRYVTDYRLLKDVLDYEKKDVSLYNYRSSQTVIDLLNRFRGDKSKEQIKAESNKEYQEIKPSFSYHQDIKSKMNGYVVLFGTHEQKYEFLGCSNLFNIYRDLYGYGGEINFDSDVLLTYQKELYEHNHDPLMNFMENVFYLRHLIKEEKPLGELVNVLKIFPFKNNFSESIRIQDLKQIEKFGKYLKKDGFEEEKVSDLISNISCFFLVRQFQEDKLWNHRWLKNKDGLCIRKVKEVFVKEFSSLFEERKAARVSSLQGSKGESYDNVLINLSVNPKKTRPKHTKQYVANAYKIYRALKVMDYIREKEGSFTVNQFEKFYEYAMEEGEESDKIQKLKSFYMKIYLVDEKRKEEKFCLKCEMRRDLYTLNLLYVSFSRAREHVHILFSENYKQFEGLMLSFGFEEKEFNLEGRN